MIVIEKLVKYNANSKDNDTGDCVKRSLSLAYNIDYDQVKRELNKIRRDTGAPYWNIPKVFEYEGTGVMLGENVIRLMVAIFADGSFPNNSTQCYFGITKQRKRKIPLVDEAIEILKDQRTLQNKLKMKSKRWHDEWNGLVFTTINGNPVGASTFRNMLIQIVGNINVDRKCSSEDGTYEEFEHCYMHSLRHTFATRCIENGMQPKTLQKILGHSTINTTMDLYVHVTDDQIYSEMEKMNIAI